MDEATKWVILTTISGLSFLVGGGWLRQWLARGQRLMTVEDLTPHFAPKAAVDELRERIDHCVTVLEFDAHTRREDERYHRMIDDLVEPLRDNSHTLQRHALALASQQTTLEHYGKAMDNLARSIDNLAAQMIQTR